MTSSDHRKVYDISPPLTSAIGVFPGDTPLSKQQLMDMHKGDHLTLSTLNGTVHLGSHVDAPSHYGVDAPNIGHLPLDLFLGSCQVIHVPVERGARMTKSHLPCPIQTERVLFRTDSFPNPNQWNKDFCALSPELVDYLKECRVRLVGIDTPSVDDSSSQTLTAHHRCLQHQIAILEGLVLTEVPDGRYELIALPLKLMEFEASPVRAVLREL